MRSHYRQNVTRGEQAESEWKQGWERYQREYPEEARELDNLVNQRLPDDWESVIPVRNRASFIPCFFWCSFQSSSFAKGCVFYGSGLTAESKEVQ